VYIPEDRMCVRTSNPIEPSVIVPEILRLSFGNDIRVLGPNIDDRHFQKYLLSCLLSLETPCGHPSLESLILLVQVTNCPIDMPHLLSVLQ
jgi:hypothetical protein